ERGHLNPESDVRALPVFRRASDFAPPHFGTSVFPKEFVGCSVPALSVIHLFTISRAFAGSRATPFKVMKEARAFFHPSRIKRPTRVFPR
ncbi:MAG: hypothetical protein ACKO23_14150, partial [Gemmataceae bacterium]